MNQIATLLPSYISILENSGIEKAVREVRLLLSFVLDQPYESIYFHTEQEISSSQQQILLSLLQRRCQGEPLAKIIGKKEFWGLSFLVTKDTLDPRPDSETLIEGILEFFPNKKAPLNILDLGTGSGCLILAALHEYPNAWGIAVDYSFAALEIAQRNAIALDLATRCSFVRDDWASGINQQVDIILCNPPYISIDEPLSVETLYDPPSALFSPKNGLADYEKIAISLPNYMHSETFLFIEIGYTQLDQVKNIFTNNGLVFKKSILDLGGHPRCLVFSKK